MSPWLNDWPAATGSHLAPPPVVYLASATHVSLALSRPRFASEHHPCLVTVLMHNELMLLVIINLMQYKLKVCYVYDVFSIGISVHFARMIHPW